MQYRKKPVVIQAVQHTGGNHPACSFMDDNGGSGAYYWKGCELYIRTLEGDHHVSEGDFVIKGVNGEFYPCKPDIFEKTYEAAEIEPCEDCEKAPVDCEGINKCNFDFGVAIRLLKSGKKVARAGWNGKGQWVCYMPSFVVEQPNERTKAHGINDAFKCGGYCVLWNAQSVWQPGWVPSQGDLFANDWQVVNNQ